MRTFLLVHGAWEAGWVWREVASRLREAGHEVYCPTLTGLGERSHLLSPAVDLETHITDVLGVIRWEQLDNVTLVGHSYGGMVVTGVADRVHEKIGSLIYLDAFLPKDDQALFDMVPAEHVVRLRKLAHEHGEGRYLPVAALPSVNVSDLELAMLKERCVPHPLAAMQQKLRVAGNHLKIPKKAFVLAARYAPSAFPRFAQEAAALGWPVESLPTHHFTMISMPRETADVLMRHAA